MRIGIDGRTYGGTTGVGRYVERLIADMSEYDTADEYIIFLCEPHFSAFRSKNPRIRKVLVNAGIFSISEQTVFLIQLYREKLDIMHFMGYFAPMGYLRPSVVTIHDLLPLFYPDKRMSGSFARLAYRTLLRSVTKRAKHVISPACHVGQDLSEMANVPEEKITVVPYDIDLSTHPISEETRKKYLFQHGIRDRYLLCVADITEHANIARFLRVCSGMRECGDVDIVIVGRENPSYHEVRETMIELSWQRRVHILASIDDSELGLLYQGASAVFSASLYEGYAPFLREAVERGIPPVCSDIPAFRETIGSDNIVFFRPLDPESIEEALRTVLSAPPTVRATPPQKKDRTSMLAEQTLRIYRDTTGASSRSIS